ncbi:MAG: response regulator transcription factor [Candidatus Methanomethylicaceae archaeon]
MHKATPTLSRYFVVLVSQNDHTERIVQDALPKDEYVLVREREMWSALEVIRVGQPDVVLIDSNFMNLLQSSRGQPHTAFILLASQILKEDIVIQGLDLGADDCIRVPFNSKEFVLRIRAILRRTKPGIDLPQRFAVDEHLVIDFGKGVVERNGHSIKLCPTGCRLLHCLVVNAGRTLSREAVLTRVWGWQFRDVSNYVRLYINQLRAKIEPDPEKPRYIVTEHGFGYKFAMFDVRANEQLMNHKVKSVGLIASTPSSYALSFNR